MKLTYANVMSTIAMVAALTTGTSYAAAQLGANTVGTRQIKDGSVQIMDLTPAIRAKLASPPANQAGESPISNVATSLNWTDTKIIATGSAPTVFSNTMDTPELINSSDQIQTRIAGTITNRGTLNVELTLAVDVSKVLPVQIHPGSRVASCQITVLAGATVNMTEACNSYRQAGAEMPYLRFIIAGGNPSVTADLKVEIKKA